MTVRTTKRASRWILAVVLVTPFALAMLNIPQFGVSLVKADPVGIKYTGTGSCAAASCHGTDYDKNKPEEKKGTEVDIWKTIDPHSKTYEQLTGDKGIAIAGKMKIPDATKNLGCLSCHALSGISTSGRVVRINLEPAILHSDVQMSEGNTCCACHGPSGKDKKAGYLVPHNAKGWTQQQRTALGSVKLFDTLGLYDTKDMKLRANLCYSCHVISDPDLIVAGHPHRPFESNVLYTRYKKKSHFAGDQDPLAESKLWAVGQAISLRESADDMAEHIKKNKGDYSIQTSYEDVLAHSLTFRQIVPGAAKKIDAAIAAIQANRAAGDKMLEPLKEIAQTADQEVDKLNSAKFDRTMAEGYLKGVASESAQAAQAGLPAASQYLFALASLYGNLKDPAADNDDKFTKIKSLAKVLKPADNQNINYTAAIKASYTTEAGAVAALFPGGTSQPFPAGAFTVPEMKNAPTATVANTEPPKVTEPPKTPEKKPETQVKTPEVKQPEVKPPEVKVVETPKVTPTEPNKVVSTEPPVAILTPRKVYEDYSNRPPLQPTEYGTCVFCLECGMRWPMTANYCGRCGKPLPRWEEKK